MKMDLYMTSRAAFNLENADADAFAAFNTIYGNLVSYSQAFRPHAPTNQGPPVDFSTRSRNTSLRSVDPDPINMLLSERG
jgi:hypothetical protein